MFLSKMRPNMFLFALPFKPLMLVELNDRILWDSRGDAFDGMLTWSGDVSG